MGGGDSRRGNPDENQEEDQPPPPFPPVEAAAVTAENYSSGRLADDPVLLLVYFHKALRSELAELRRLAVSAAESVSHSRDLVTELIRRFEFLKLVYKYHCAAEDEVVFLALDMHVKNVAFTYSLEHGGIDDLFGSIFRCLNVSVEDDGKPSKALQELVYSIGTIQSVICHHMLKEEQQVYTLLMQHFSFQEQALLMWQFLCSVPIMLLQDCLPWMVSFLSPDDQVNVVHCLQEVIPQDESLQEVVISWLGENNQTFYGACSMIGRGYKYLDGSANMKNILHKNAGHQPVDGLHIWHRAIRKDLNEIVEELSQMKSSSSFPHLDLVVVRLKFLCDVLIFYSNALEKFFYPVLTEINGHQFRGSGQFPIENHIGNLQRLLHHEAQSDPQLLQFVEKLFGELQYFVVDISMYFAVQEVEVFPIISKNCTHETQQQLLYMSLHVLPLGLLKCVITWFSAFLSEDESQSIFQSISHEDSLVNKYFSNLLLEWFHIGYSGKTSVENFRKHLQKIFKSRCSFLPELVKEPAGSSSSSSVKQPCKRSNPKLMARVTPHEGKKSLSYSSSGCHTTNKCETPYSSGVNLHIFFPGTIRPLHPFPHFSGEQSSSSFVNELIPVDLIFFCHKAMKKDLDYLVFGSARLAENIEFLGEFCQRFHVIQFLCQIHSNAEDEIAFPALEAKGKVQNISHAYAMDHELEVEYFSKISLILDEISELNISVSSTDSKTLDQRNLKHHQLCINLQDMCKSIHKLLSDHLHREELQLWPLFKECLSIKEQEKIIACMLGRMPAEMLQEMIPWLMASLTPEEQHAAMSLWRQAAKRTMFDEWLAEWWEGYETAKVPEDLDNPLSFTEDPLEIISTYLSKEVDGEPRGIFCDNGVNFPQTDHVCADIKPLEKSSVADKPEFYNGEHNYHECLECSGIYDEGDKETFYEVGNITGQISSNQGQPFQVTQKSRQYEHLLTISQEDLEAAIRRVSRDSSLDARKKSYIMQNLLMSRWIIRQQMEGTIPRNGEEIPGRCPSYRDPLELTFGCKHYKRNCKLFTPCCNQLFTCIRCHDEVADHLVDRKSITKMMCMKCLFIQPIGPMCSSVLCNNLAMGRYYCKICKLFDDEREIYHCPYCNLCRVGKGLGIDYFHCMNCNACMSKSLFVHICREKSLEDNCPICHEYIFTSSSPVKALPCGHVMHSACFQEYTCTHYTCPICTKSLGDMQVYFRMLDALLADEKIPDEYAGQTQVILCNDCERKGRAPFHWLYHKCSYCGSYNTRLL